MNDRVILVLRCLFALGGGAGVAYISAPDHPWWSTAWRGLFAACAVWVVTEQRR